MGRPIVVLTNDDGIDAPGLASPHEELTAIAEATVVAPAANQSGVARARDGRVTIADHPWGYELHGTPADCVAFGLGGGVETTFALVVAGVNDGPNIGNYVIGRSGTTGACVEAAFLDVPGIAVLRTTPGTFIATRQRTTSSTGQPPSRARSWRNFTPPGYRRTSGS